MAPPIEKTVKVACKKCDGNALGYYVCYAADVPKGAKLFKEAKEDKKAE